MKKTPLPIILTAFSTFASDPFIAVVGSNGEVHPALSNTIARIAAAAPFVPLTNGTVITRCSTNGLWEMDNTNGTQLLYLNLGDSGFSFNNLRMGGNNGNSFVQTDNNGILIESNNGSGLTNVPASSLTGTLDVARLATNSINSNKFDAATQALLGSGGSGGAVSTNLFYGVKIGTNEAYASTGTATSGAPRIILGNRTASGDDAAIALDRDVAGAALFSHGITDESRFNTISNGAYCTFDVRYTAADNGATNAYNHLNCFQARPNWYGTNGYLGALYGHTFQPYVSGPIGEIVGFLCQTLTLTNGANTGVFYGVRVDTQRTNITAGFSLYSSDTRLPLYNAGVIQTSTNVNCKALVASGTIDGTSITGTSFNYGSYSHAGSYGWICSGSTTASITAQTNVNASARSWTISSGDGSTKTNGFVDISVDGVVRLHVTKTNAVFANGVASQATNTDSITTSGWTNSLGVNAVIDNCTGITVNKFNRLGTNVCNYGTITTGISILVQPGGWLTGSSMAGNISAF